MKILLVEDNISIAEGIIYALNKVNYEVVHITTYAEALKYIQSSNNNIDIYILDVMLDKKLGTDLSNCIVNKPVIFLTARDDEYIIDECLKRGEYINKPFKISELIVRIKKLTKEYINEITVKDITFNIDEMTVSKNGNTLTLTALEIKLLYILFTNINKVITREYLINYIWDITGNDVNDNTISVYFKRIREKIDSDIITTVKGIGYKINGK